MALLTPQWAQSGSYSATADRRLFQALWPKDATEGLAVSPGPPGPFINIDVAPGQALVHSPSDTGPLLCTSTDVHRVEIAPVMVPGMRRIDVIAVAPRAPDFNGLPQTDFLISYVLGTMGETPPAPPIPPGVLGLAEVQVLYGDVVVTPLQIRDIRPGGLSIEDAVAHAAGGARGLVAQIFGPPTTVNYNAVTLTTCLTLTAPVEAGRVYKLTAHGQAVYVPGSGSSARNFWRIATPAALDFPVEWRMNTITGVVTAVPWWGGGGSMTYTALTGGNRTWELQVFGSEGGRVDPNNAALILEDVGAAI